MTKLCVRTTSTSGGPSCEGCFPQRQTCVLVPEEQRCRLQEDRLCSAAGLLPRSPPNSDQHLGSRTHGRTSLPTQPFVISHRFDCQIHICQVAAVCSPYTQLAEFERHKLSSRNQEESWPPSGWPREVSQVKTRNSPSWKLLGV